MKKNNKGFFLAETIVMVALVTAIMAFVYPNVSKLYGNYKNKTEYYDQTEDLYTLRAIYEKHSVVINENIDNIPNSTLSIIDDASLNEDKTNLNITKLYVAKYNNNNLSSNNYNFNKYLKRLTYYDNGSIYRLIGVFNDRGKKRYASIGILSGEANDED